MQGAPTAAARPGGPKLRGSLLTVENRCRAASTWTAGGMLSTRRLGASSHAGEGLRHERDARAYICYIALWRRLRL